MDSGTKWYSMEQTFEVGWQGTTVEKQLFLIYTILLEQKLFPCAICLASGPQTFDTGTHFLE